MKHTVQILIAIIYVSGIYGCDFLEKTPTELAPETYYKNADEAFSALVGVYSVLSSHMFYGENVIYLLCGDDLSYYGGNRQPATKGIICNNATVSDASTNNMWFILYTGIDRANQFLENIGRIPVDDLSEDLRLQYIAEARFLRAFYYFHLVQGWGDVPFKTTATHSVNNLQIAATDRQTIYDFIISEMDYAASNGLKSASELSYQPGYISQSAAWGIIARVYLFRAGEHYRQDRAANDAETSTYFAKAKEYAEKVLFEGHSLATNYWDYFIDLCSDNYNTTANESIWEVEFTGNYEGDIRAEGRWGNMIGMSSPDLSMYNFSGKADPGYSPAVIHCTPKLYNLYVKNNDICRMNWSISPFIYEFNTVDGVYGRRFHKGKMNEVMAQYGNESYKYDGDYENPNELTDYGALYCAKYRREYEPVVGKKNKNYTCVNFPILRYADVLLMLAEAENEVNGPTVLAYNCINEIRERAKISPLDAGLDKEEFRTAIKDERAMELCFECLRRYDLIRWGDYIVSMHEMAELASIGEAANWKCGLDYGKYLFFQVPQAYLYLPVPERELSINTLLEQNPGW